jgi:hypothetical protein
MKLTGFLIVAALLVSGGCNKQTDKISTPGEGSGNPKPTIKVSKEYDKDGNLIRYDSTYSYHYSTSGNNLLMNDSVFNTFKDHFNQSYFFLNEPFFEHFFFDDSLMIRDFYKDDFFIHRFRNNSTAMDSLFLKMDKYKNEFFEKQFKDYQEEHLKKQ